jgi:hypothetical protein
MDWEAASSRLNAACLGAFGRQVTYTPQAGSSFALTGILDRGARPENAAPGTYALLFVSAAAFALPPARGDEVTVDGSIYKLVDLEADAEGGLGLVLHFNRECRTERRSRGRPERSVRRHRSDY